MKHVPRVPWKNCPKCGTKIIPGNAFCTSCGHQVAGSEVVEKVIKRYQEKDDRKKIILRIIASAIFIAISITLYYFIEYQPEDVIVIIVMFIVLISICIAMGIYRRFRPKTRLSLLEKKIEKLEVVQEEKIALDTPEEKPEELEEIPVEEEVLPEEKVVVSIPEEQVEELRKSLNIDQLRSKFKNELEKIREIVHRENFYISLSGIDEVIVSLENLNLKDRREIMDIYLNKLIEYSIDLRENPYKHLINENDVKKANLEIHKTEIDLMRRILPIEGIKVSKPERQPEKVETIQEEAQIISLPIEKTEEVKIIQDKEVIFAPAEKLVKDLLLEEIPSALEKIPKEEIVVSAPEEQPEELIPPEPQIIKCHFCGMEIKEETTFCPQCGMVFKKK